jgi:Na+-translocating ferredoxin:NAD+ oxidoreductase RnfG subunit
MGKAGNQSLMEGVRGKVGRKAVFRKSYGETVVCVLPSKTTKINEGQIARRAKFKLAIGYGKRQMLKPEVKALYETGVNSKKRSAYLVATSDFMKAPSISKINNDGYTGAVGQQIFITATDDFKVNQVTVVITTAAGQEIERGLATVSDGFTDSWVYVTTAVNPALAGSKITATAVDLPGNLFTQSVNL